MPLAANQDVEQKGELAVMDVVVENREWWKGRDCIYIPQK